MSNIVIARLRTAVPAAWAALITALVAAAPATPEVIVTWLSSEATVVAVVGLATLAWHWVWTRVGPHVPDWVETIVMGHTGTAVYPAKRPDVDVADDDEFDNPDSPQFTREPR